MSLFICFCSMESVILTSWKTAYGNAGQRRQSMENPIVCLRDHYILSQFFYLDLIYIFVSYNLALLVTVIHSSYNLTLLEFNLQGGDAQFPLAKVLGSKNLASTGFCLSYLVSL